MRKWKACSAAAAVLLAGCISTGGGHFTNIGDGGASDLAGDDGTVSSDLAANTSFDLSESTSRDLAASPLDFATAQPDLTGPCSACGSGTLCCGGRCVNPLTDNTNCGACDNLCVTGMNCQSGSCACQGGPGCTVGSTCCSSGCRNLMNDSNNCGGCGVRCGAGEICDRGRCGCLSGGVHCTTGQTCCAGGCVDTSSDRFNCGFCNNACPSGLGCTKGTCGSPDMATTLPDLGFPDTCNPPCVPPQQCLFGIACF